MGDFNAKLGRGKSTEKFIGRYGIKQRNERGEKMATMVESNGYYVGNSWFRKKPSRRWTWISPNSKTKNEVDYIMVNKESLFWNVEIVPMFNTGSDHRLLLARIHIRGLKTEKTRRSNHRTKSSTRAVDGRLLEESLRCATFQDTDDIDADYLCFINTLKSLIERAET
ncbi:hypothetical protein Y032_0022g521 [Ancylostoma ceylanicum]|uniref:Endonuclease/exonuclease/phosphatase domain-containing protein n=1 Tax=Ancylostoma ceylanicum TaxID=53326 RepID=A0A016UYH1_9BILA|nr:hypothetical protein Y032_0022g521 [Ancylostoma ceylanicum]